MLLELHSQLQRTKWVTSSLEAILSTIAQVNLANSIQVLLGNPAVEAPYFPIKAPAAPAISQAPPTCITMAVPWRNFGSIPIRQQEVYVEILWRPLITLLL